MGLCGHPIGCDICLYIGNTLDNEYTMRFQPSCFCDRSHFTWSTEVKWSLICLSSPRIFTREADSWWTKRSSVALVYNQLYTNYNRSQVRSVFSNTEFFSDLLLQRQEVFALYSISRSILLQGFLYGMYSILILGACYLHIPLMSLFRRLLLHYGKIVWTSCKHGAKSHVAVTILLV